MRQISDIIGTVAGKIVFLATVCLLFPGVQAARGQMSEMDTVGKQVATTDPND